MAWGGDHRGKMRIFPLLFSEEEIFFLSLSLFSFSSSSEITGVACLNGRTNLVLQTIRDRPPSSPPSSRSASCKFQRREAFSLHSRETRSSFASLFYLAGKICHHPRIFIVDNCRRCKDSLRQEGGGVVRGGCSSLRSTRGCERNKKEEEVVSKSPIIKTRPSKKKLLISKVRVFEEEYKSCKS